MSDTGWAALLLGDHVLAESPRWDAVRRRLSWVDIPTGTLCAATRTCDGWQPTLRRRVSRLATAAEPDGDGWWVASGREVMRVDESGSRVGTPVTVAPTYPDVRTNDMVRTPDGALLVGLFAEDRTSAVGGACRVDPVSGVVTPVVEGMVTANGLGFSPDARTLYAVDTARGTLTAYAYDPDTGAASEPRLLVTEPAPGRLDGLAVDAGGDLWIAVWGLGEVRRYDPSGRAQQTLLLPVERPTAVAQVDSLLVVTTARSDLTPPTTPLEPSPEGRLHAYRLAS